MAEQSDTVASVKLQVAGAQGPDVGKGVARLSREALEQLNLRQGDVVELSGKRVTAALALPPYQEDEGLAIVRLDGLMRANAGTRSEERRVGRECRCRVEECALREP